MPLASMRPGTIIKPPPMPKKPDIAPTTSPIAIRRTAIQAVMRTSGLPAAARGRSMATPTTIIASANRNNNCWPSTSFPIVEPKAAPRIPASAKVAAQGHLTLPARQWPSRLANAFAATERGAGADGHVWIADADDIEEKRHSEDRTAPANQSERESHPHRPKVQLAPLDPKKKPWRECFRGFVTKQQPVEALSLFG